MKHKLKYFMSDNGGETIDRYTLGVYDPNTGVWNYSAANDRPYHPQGFGMMMADQSRPGDPEPWTGDGERKFTGKDRDIPADVRRFFGRLLRYYKWALEDQDCPEPRCP